MKRPEMPTDLPTFFSNPSAWLRLLRWTYRTLALLAFLAIPGLLATSTALRAAPDLASVDAATASMARVIVKFREGAELTKMLAVDATIDEAVAKDLLQRRADVLASRVGVALTTGRAVGPRGQVVMARGVSAQSLAATLAQDPNIEYAEVDRVRRALWVPTDPLYATGPTNGKGPTVGQWYLRAPDTTLVSAANLPGAWDRTRGAANMVVAVLDSGILKDHPDLNGQYLAGYDFIDNAAVANDGDRRDSDPSDPGDWITSAEDKQSGGFFNGCGASGSSWHGTQVASIIAAATNNGIGMAGIASNAKVLPARVLGKCGGYDSDIQAALNWAAGIDQAGVPTNTTPAKVINMSLGSDGACTQSYKDTLAAVAAKGTVVVAAAGNSAGLAVGVPANCPGVLAVGGLRHIGTKVGFSDLGPEVAISAPGGNCVNLGANEPCLYPIITALNSGTQGPLASGYTYSDSYSPSVGTSFSSPIVAGTVALMMSANPALTPADVKRILQTTARAFPTTGSTTDTVQCKPPTSTEQLECYCTTTTCGAGMLDAAAAVAASVIKPVAKVDLSTTSPTAGSSVQVTAAGSTAGTGRSLVGYAWTLKDGGGVVTGFSTATNAATAAFTPSAAGTVVVQVTVTDDLGVQGTAELSIVVAAAPVPPTPTPTPSTSGGGGSMSVLWLAALWGAAWLLRRQQRRETLTPPGAR